MTGTVTCVSALCLLPPRSTGKERDSESGNDYFGARYYASSMGRFMSPDPSELYFAGPTNPQSLNLYAYALNNPLKFTDPTGMYCYYGDTDFTSSQGQKDQNDSTHWDYHSNKAECEKADENGNKGQWYDDADTHGGMDDVGRPDYAVSTNTFGSNSPQVTQSQAMRDFVISSTPGWIYDIPSEVIFTPQNRPPDNYRFATTRYCGPGGGGTPKSGLDTACQAHDQCYDQNHLSANSNTGGGTLTPTQTAVAKSCNQALYNYARSHPNEPGSKAIQGWLLYGEHTPFGAFLAPGTAANPW